MRGEREDSCLKSVQNIIKEGDASLYLGLKIDEVNMINDLLNNAKPNKEQSKFPDFIISNGFIEHFQITSSKTTSKGAEHIKKINNFKDEIVEERKKFEEQVNNINLNDSIHFTMSFPEHKHEFLEKSFKNNWNNHIESYDKYDGEKEKGIFMIEYSDNALEMLENVYSDWINGMSCGDLRKGEHLNNYRLSRDKEILNYIYLYKEKIQYVIFVYGKKCEVIKTESIPYILKLMPWDYVIAPHMGAMVVASTYRI